MPASVQTYSLSPGWSSSELLDVLEDAFRDAGLYVAAPFDRFSSGDYHHLVVEVVYNAAKTYGKRYFRFCCYDGGLYVSIANGWDASAHVPTGVEYLDHPGNLDPEYLNNFWFLRDLSPGTSLILRRYTSGVNGDFSAFRVGNGSSRNASFFLTTAGMQLQPWVDLNRTSFGMIHIPAGTTSNSHSRIGFPYNLGVRRDVYTGPALNDRTGGFDAWHHNHFNYAIWGKSPSNYGNWEYSTSDNPFAQYNSQAATVIALPTDDPDNNPAYVSPKMPVFSGLPFNAYLQDSMPIDFGVAGLYTNASTPGDRIVVESDVEEWEIVYAKNSPYNASGFVSIAFAARVV